MRTVIVDVYNTSMLDNTVLLVDYVYNVYEIKSCYLSPTLLLCQITQFHFHSYFDKRIEKGKV